MNTENDENVEKRLYLNAIIFVKIKPNWATLDAVVAAAFILPQSG